MGADRSGPMGADRSGPMGADDSGPMGADDSGPMGADDSGPMGAIRKILENSFNIGELGFKLKADYEAKKAHKPLLVERQRNKIKYLWND